MPAFSIITMTTTFATLFDQPNLDAARDRRDSAMAAVSDAAGAWNDSAWAWLVGYLETHEEFFPDDVWAAGCPVPDELRAFGPLVLRASRKGYIVKTSKLRQRTRGHATVAVVWRSTLYRNPR